MNKRITLLLTLALYGINTLATQEIAPETITYEQEAYEPEMYEQNVYVQEKQATPITQPTEEKELVLTWDENSTLLMIKNLYEKKQLTKGYLQLFIKSHYNRINLNATSIKELNLCAILEKQQQIITTEINTINIKRAYNGNYSFTRWCKLLYGIGMTGGLSYSLKDKLYAQNFNHFVKSIQAILEPFTKEPITDSNVLAKKLAIELQPIYPESIAILGGILILGGTGYCGYRAYRLYNCYTCISRKEKEIALLNTIIAHIRDIENNE